MPSMQIDSFAMIINAERHMILDINSITLSLHGIALWCAISGVICVIDGDTRQLIVSPSDNPTVSG